MIPRGMGLAGTQARLTYEAALELYEAARFVDAFNATKELWADKANALKLDTRETVLAARLASRLGGAKIASALFDLARKRDPQSPLVRYYCRHRRRHRTLFDELKDFVADPEIATDDTDLKASWFASHAATFSLIRDFDNAERYIKRAHEQNSPRGWVHSCHADILLRQDKREQALEIAREAWRRQPGMPYTAGSLNAALGELGRNDEAREILRPLAHTHGQSFDVLLNYTRAVLQSMERGDDAARTSGAAEIRSLVPRFEALAPLADRFALRSLNWVLIEAARLCGDHAALTELAAKLDWPFYNRVAANLAKNPEGRRLLLPHKPVQQDHNTCLPASVCAALSTLGIEVSQHELAEQLTFDGTPSWRVNEWAEKRGLVARHFVADRAGVEALLAAGLGFVIGFDYLNNAHACAGVGADFALGTVLIHDPSFTGLSEQLLEFLDKGEAPLGPRCVALYPKAEAARFGSIALKGEQEASARVEFQRVREKLGATEAARWLEGAGVGETPQGRFLRMWALGMTGHPRESLELVREMVAQWPDCVALQRSLIAGTEAMGNTAQMREVLRNILARAPLPGAAQGSEYIYPAPHLYARYAGLLQRSAEYRDEAWRVSQRALRRGPFEAEAYVVRGDIHWFAGQFAEALLPYRCASTLYYENDSYARYYADTLHKLGREREAIAWLEKRAEHYADKLDATGPWRVLVDTLEDFGYPDEALAKLREGLRRRPKDGVLAAFAAIFFSRYARTSEAREALEAAREHAPTGEYHNAACAIARMMGGLQQAMEHALKRLEHEPNSLNAHHVLLYLTEQTQGPDAALALCEAWVQERAHDEDYEGMLLDRLDRTTQRERRLKILRDRLARNDLDAWAWRELAFTLLESASMSGATARIDAARDLEQAVERSTQTSADLPVASVISAEYLMLKGRREEAFAACSRAVEMDGTYSWAIGRLFEIADALGGDYAKRAADTVDAALWRTQGQWSLAPMIADKIGHALGVDEARRRVSRWLRRARRDPYPVSAWAELLLDHGRGVRDARRVLRRVQRAVARFPLHINLRYALAHALSVLQRPEEEALALAQITEIAPRETRARVLLAETLEFLNRPAEAEAALSKAAELDPLDHRVWMTLADFHERQGKPQRAIDALKEGCAKLPDNMNLWERRIALLEKVGRAEEALGVAQEVAQRYPKGALAQLILARAMRKSMVRARRRDIEAQFEKALSLNAQFFDAIDEYADFLCLHTEYDKAREVIERHLRAVEDPAPLKLKLGEILRAKKRNKEAREAVIALVRERPDYYWGWRRMLEWSEEDKQFEPATTLLAQVPPSLAENAVFRAERLEFLEKAKAPKAEIEQEWQQLLADFPQHRGVNLRRCDQLLEANRFADAAALLERYAQYDANDAFTISDQVRAMCGLKRQDDALNFAMRLWFEATVEHWDACEDAIAALEKANWAGVNLGMVNERMAQGQMPQPMAARVLAYKAGKAGEKRFLTEFARLLEPRALEHGSWDVFTTVLDALEEAGEMKWVIGFSERHAEACKGDPQLWMIVGRALRMDGRHGQARTWYADWRSRKGVEMWGVSNYVGSLLHLQRFDECIENGVAALEELEHDHSGPYLVENMILAAVLAGDEGRTLQLLADWGDVLARVEKPTPLQRVLELYEGMVRETSGMALLRIDRSFRKVLKGEDLPLPKELALAWRKSLFARLSWPLKVWRFLVAA